MTTQALDTTARQEPGGDVQTVEKLVAVATKAAGTIKSLGLHGKGVSGAQSRCTTILKGVDPAKRLRAGQELAASLQKGNADAKKLAAEILDALQPTQPAAPPSVSPAVATPAEATADNPGVTKAGPDAGGQKAASVTAPATSSDRHEGEIVLVAIADLKPQAPFDALFPITPSTLSAIVADMQQHGYDGAHPIAVWDGIPIDGNTRLKAAQQAGLTHVPVVHRSFADENEAFEYAIHCQRDRRNLTDADILRLVEELDHRRTRGGDRRGEGAPGSKTSGEVFDSAEATADLIGTSATKVEGARAVLDSGDETLTKSVKSGAKSIRKGAAEARAAKRTPAKKEAAYLLERTKGAEALKAADQHLRPSDPAIADQIVALRNAVLEIISRAKAEAKSRSKEVQDASK